MGRKEPPPVFPSVGNEKGRLDRGHFFVPPAAPETGGLPEFLFKPAQAPSGAQAARSGGGAVCFDQGCTGGARSGGGGGAGGTRGGKAIGCSEFSYFTIRGPLRIPLGGLSGGPFTQEEFVYGGQATPG